MNNMEEMNTDDQLVTIHFDDDADVELNKSYLIEHSAYFQAMFSGYFVESQTGHRIHIKDISFDGFMKVINSLQSNKVVFNGIEDILLILEVSQLLQFSFIIFESIKIIKEKYLFTNHAIDIFPEVSKLGLQNLLDKSRAYILYNFTTILKKNKFGFLKLNERDLQSLLNSNSLNVANEKDVYDLIIDWCSTNNGYNFEYELAVSCVHFNVMSKEELECCISKTKNSILQDVIKPYIDISRENHDTVSLIRPIRCIPYVLCAVKNEDDGHAFIYRWDWSSMQFTKFLRLDPLPLDTTGYHVFIKDLDVYVLAGEIAFGRGMWNKEGWKYNLLTENWKRLQDFHPSSRRHGVGYFCGDNLYLIGGLTKHRLPNQVIEHYGYDSVNDTLVLVNNTVCPYFQQRANRVYYTSLEYKGNLALITKDNEPTWYDLSINPFNKGSYKWRRRLIDLNEVVICATALDDIVYMLTYDQKRVISLHSYCPMFECCQKLKSFTIKYDEATTMCAFNVDKAMVFKNDTFEYYSVDNDYFIEYKIQLNSFHSDYLFSVPIYINKTY
ncbi:uncharacterized protein LOC113556504 [Rhopalosiphum maidis]|uniref:uncharacterized protein LOC113556504 n=1 Tax=Rhopalosiphum maidis TaxID=43146 RepID=UPI000F00C50B|nr:uncharacterized protein LOC113556504 [Rhopalosiphum maidis]